MQKIFFRNQGQGKEISLSEDHLLNILINEFQFANDIEINLCLFGNLGNELFLDPHLERKLENEIKDRS
ncbi:MAG: hypothetical protein KAW51_06195 [Candidatus Lokiarchaeota archaeon]|nr:hypothetical protein [Candidatus Lokiarchaeota archaeon]